MDSDTEKLKTNAFIVYGANASRAAAIGDTLTTGIAVVFLIVIVLIVVGFGAFTTLDGFTVELRAPSIHNQTTSIGRNPIELVIGLVIVGAGLLIIYGVFRYYIVNVRQKARRFELDGKRIIGEIVECSGHTTEDDYAIKVRYGFVTPDGQEIVQEVNTVRNDLKNKALPGPGTQVRVIYINDEEFKVL